MVEVVVHVEVIEGMIGRGIGIGDLLVVMRDATTATAGVTIAEVTATCSKTGDHLGATTEIDEMALPVIRDAIVMI